MVMLDVSRTEKETTTDIPVKESYGYPEGGSKAARFGTPSSSYTH